MFSEAADDADPDIAVTLLGGGETIDSGSRMPNSEWDQVPDPGTSVFGIRNLRVDPFTSQTTGSQTTSAS